MKDKQSLSRRERDRHRQRQEMLAAALQLFSEKGYHNVAMNEIAERAEFAIGTIYKFFKSKEELYTSLIAEQGERFHLTLRQALEEGDDVIEKLRNYVRFKGRVFIDNISVVRLYFTESQGASFNVKAGLSADLREKYEQNMQLTAGVFQRGMDEGLFNRIADPYHLAIALETFTNSFLWLWLEDPGRHPYPEDPDVILNILFKGLLVG
ncbi:MAG: TetR/AcrR family transcriptional regulator [Pseudomonadota bacterium]